MAGLRLRVQIFLLVLVGIMVVGTLGFMVIERLSLGDALYFSIVTIATVGYGDIHPATHAGKILAVFLIVTGVGTFLGVVANGTELMLHKREQRTRLEKLNMVIGLFFSEFGTRLLAYFSGLDPQREVLRRDLVVTGDWSHDDFIRMREVLRGYRFSVSVEHVQFQYLRTLLNEHRDLLMRLLENPSLLEHETFTELLRAVFHLKEELVSRPDIEDIPDSDKLHLQVDIQRAYVLLVKEWLAYMEYLRDNYPYLFSLAMRTNPFDRNASVIVQG
jgi:hypothetical protein